MNGSELPDREPTSNDGKEPQAFRTIGEVAKALGIRQHVLRYWEEQFPTLRPLTRAGGRRYYRPEDVALIVEIDRLLHREGYTIKGAKQALGGKKRLAVPEPKMETVPAQDAVAAPPHEPAAVESAAPLIEFLQAIRNRLAEAIGD